MSDTRAVVFAYHDVGVRCLKTLLSGGVEVPLVVTVADDPQEIGPGMVGIRQRLRIQGHPHERRLQRVFRIFLVPRQRPGVAHRPRRYQVEQFRQRHRPAPRQAPGAVPYSGRKRILFETLPAIFGQHLTALPF